MICPGCGEIVSFSADDMGDISFDVRHLDDDRYAIGVYPASSDAGPFMSLITLHECRDDGKQADSPRLRRSLLLRVLRVRRGNRASRRSADLPI